MAKAWPDKQCTKGYRLTIKMPKWMCISPQKLKWSDSLCPRDTKPSTIFTLDGTSQCRQLICNLKIKDSLKLMFGFGQFLLIEPWKYFNLALGTTALCCLHSQLRLHDRGKRNTKQLHHWLLRDSSQNNDEDSRLWCHSKQCRSVPEFFLFVCVSAVQPPTDSPCPDPSNCKKYPNNMHNHQKLPIMPEWDTSQRHKG